MKSMDLTYDPHGVQIGFGDIKPFLYRTFSLSLAVYILCYTFVLYSNADVLEFTKLGYNQKHSSKESFDVARWQLKYAYSGFQSI